VCKNTYAQIKINSNSAKKNTKKVEELREQLAEAVGSCAALRAEMEGREAEGRARAEELRRQSAARGERLAEVARSGEAEREAQRRGFEERLRQLGGGHGRVVAELQARLAESAHEVSHRWVIGIR
jgi:hypothetical protein